MTRRMARGYGEIFTLPHSPLPAPFTCCVFLSFPPCSHPSAESIAPRYVYSLLILLTQLIILPPASLCALRRLEGLLHLRNKMKLTVKLRVDGGKVKGSAAASEEGGLLSLITCVIQNQMIATPGCPTPSAAPTEARNRSGVNSAVSSAPTTAADLAECGGAPNAFPMTGSEADQDSPPRVAAPAAGDAPAAAPAAAPTKNEATCCPLNVRGEAVLPKR